MYTTDYHFTKEDAYANRYGKLTQQQEELVDAIYQTRWHGVTQTIAVFIVFFFVLIVFGIGVEFNNWEGTFTDFSRQTVPILIAVIGIFSVLLLMTAIVSFVVAQDARKRRISTVEGKATLYIGEIYVRGSYMRYELSLHSGLFRTGFFRFMSETALRQFESGKRYRLYYIKFYPLPIILSAEEI